jgi:hypothetical protein
MLLQVSNSMISLSSRRVEELQRQALVSQVNHLHKMNHPVIKADYASTRDTSVTLFAFIASST